jgi:nitrate/nitrite transport system ATP-binding protein
MGLLEMQNVQIGFGGARNRLEVLRNIHFVQQPGEFVAIVGWSGSGKTTLLSLMAGLLMPDQGRVLFDGKLVDGPSRERGVVFQNYSLLPWLSVLENVDLGVAAVMPHASREQREERVGRYLRMVGLEAAAQKRPSELSGGMRQRVSVARALSMEPRMLLLDEPFGALDALTRGQLQEEVVRIRRESGTTICLITNDVDEALFTADRIIPLTAGPGATLGPSFRVPERGNRPRAELRSADDFREVRKEVIDFLLGEGRGARMAVRRKLILPDLIPEDLTHGRPLIAAGRKAKRRNEVKVEDVHLAS